MAENTIDSLELKITSDSKEAADGIDRLSRSLLELEGSVSKGSSGLASLQKALQGLSSGSGKIDLKIMDSAEIAGFEGNVKELTKYVQEYSDTAKNVKPLVPKVEDANVIRTLEGIQEKYKDLGKDFKVFGTLDALQKQLDKYSNALENAKLKKQELELSGNTGGKQYEKVISDVIKYENILGNINAQIKKMDISNIKIMSDEEFQVLPTIKKQAEEAAMSLQELGEKARDSGRVFENVWNGVEIPESLKTVDFFPNVEDEFEKKLANLKIPSIDTKTIDELEKKLESAKERLESLKIKLENDITMGRVTVDVDDKGYQKAREQIALTEKEINQFETVIGHFNSVEKAKNALASLGHIALGTASNAFKLLGKAVSGTYSIIKTFGNGIKNVVSKIAKLGKGLSGLLGVNKKNNSSFKTGLKTLLKYGFGVRSLYFLFRRFRGAIVDGYKNLVQYSSEVNHSISSVKSSLTMLKNAFAAAFSPIVNIVAPYLSTFIDMLSSAFNAVGRFFSALTGKSYAVQAKKAMEDYAGSIDSATGSAKKLDKQLSVLPFDQLNQLSKDADSSSGGGSGNGDGVNAKDMFETVELEGDSWGKRIRDMFLSEDWQGLGEEVASGLNAGLQKVYAVISWDNVSKYVTPFIQGFTTSINSLVDNLNFMETGEVVGAGINTIINTLNSLIGENGIDFRNIGLKISDGLCGAIEEIGWTELGNLFGNKFMISWNVLSGFVDGLARKNNAGISGWTELGNSIGEAFNGMLESVNLETIASSLVGALNGVFDSVTGFAQTFNWEQFGINVINGLTTAFYTFDPKTVSGALSEIVKGILSSLNAFFLNANWKDIGQTLVRKIKEFITEIDWAGISDSLFEFIGVFFASLGQFLIGVIGEALKGIGDYFLGFINQELGGLDEDASILEIGWAIISGIFKGIGNAILDVGKWIKDHIFTPFIEGFKNAFGIHSPSTVMEEQGGFIIDGLLNGLKSAIGGVLEWVGGIPGWFKEKLGNAKDWLVDKGKDALEGLKNGWETVKNSSLVQNAKSLGSTIITNVGNAKDWLVQKGKDAVSGLQTGWENIKSSSLIKTVGNLGKELITGIGDLSIDTKPKGEQAVTGMSEGVTQKTSVLNESFSKISQAAVKSLDSAQPQFREIGTKLILSLNTGIASGVPKVTKQVSSMVDSIANSFKPLNTKMGSLGKSFMENLSNGILNNKAVVQRQITSLMELITNALKPMPDRMRQYGMQMMTALSTGISSNSQLVRNQVNNLVNNRIINIVTPVTQKLKTIGANSIQSMSIGMNGAFGNITTAMNNLLNKVQSYQTTFQSKGNNIGKLLAYGISQGITSSFSYVNNSMQSLMNLVFSYKDQLQSKGNNMGQWLNYGIHQGINSSLSYITGTMEKVVNLVFSYKERFQSSGDNMGQWLNYGIYQGINSSIGYINSAMGNILNSINGYNNGMYNAGRSLAQSLQSGLNSISISAPSVSSSISSGNRKSTRNISADSSEPVVSLSGMPGAISTFSGFGQIGISPELQKYAPYELGAGIAAQPISARIEDSPYMRAISGSPANNFKNSGIDQTILRDAVAQGFALAMMNNQGSNSAPEYIQNSIYLDGDVIARSVSKAQRDTDRRYNPTPRYGY